MLCYIGIDNRSNHTPIACLSELSLLTHAQSYCLKLTVFLFDARKKNYYCANSGSFARGEMSAKTTYSRTAKGAMAISDCPPDGRFVRLENSGKKVYIEYNDKL